MYLPRRLALAFLLSVAPAALAAQTADQLRATLSSLSGHVVEHENGGPIADARLSIAPLAPLEHGAATRLSADDGSYRFADLAAGRYMFRVEAAGYAVAEHELEVAGGSEISVVVRLSASAIQLDPLVAVTERDAWFMDGFEERRAAAKTHTGFFTHDEMEEMNAKYISEVLWTVPGVDVQSRPISLSGPGRSSRGPYANRRPGPPGAMGNLTNPLVAPGCLSLFVNGQHVGGAVPFDDIFPPDDIAALEVYGQQHDVPAQFHRPEGCGAVVVWLREREFPSVWKRLAAGAALLGGVLLLAR